MTKSRLNFFAASAFAAGTVPLGLYSCVAQSALPTSSASTKTESNIGASGTYINPVLDADRPDPDILRVKNRFYMLHTMGGPPGWPLYQSSDMIHWKFSKHLLTEENKPEWIKDSLWAPEIHRVGAKFVLTFTARSNLNDRLCVGIAVANAIDGPYKVQSAPLVTDDVAVIDSHIFEDENGQNYLIWKRDGPKSTGIGGSIRARRLDDEGTHFAPDSKEIVLLSSDKTGQEWERGLIEAPWMLQQDGMLYLIYSGAFIGTDFSYRVGVARSKSMTTTFQRFEGNPILANNEKYGGPGHGAFELDSKGQLWHLYHARDKTSPNDPSGNPPGKGRVQLLDRVIWQDGWPSFGNGGTPSTTPQTAPALGDFPPYVWMTKSRMGEKGLLNLTAGAEDDQKVTGVEFFLSTGAKQQSIGRANLKNDTWQYLWNSKRVPNGLYQFFARASDAAGHITTSRNFTIKVAN